LRFSTFWEQLEAQLGEIYAKSYAQDQVISDLGCTPVRAFELGFEPIAVWRAIASQEGWPD